MRLILILSLTTLSAFAAGNGGHGSVTDLIAPAINFFILFGFLAFKLKGPAREHFTNKAKNIKETIERASQKSQQAEAKMKEQKDKMNNLDNAKKEILASAENEANDFANRNKKETTERIEKNEKRC
jgi:F-type H+-transporting ATPase subunit b